MKRRKYPLREKIVSVRITFETEHRAKETAKWSEIKALFKRDYDELNAESQHDKLIKNLKIEKVGERYA